MLKETAKSDYPLYAKIGCQHRGTYTSTKLQLIVYTDKQCSKVYGGENNEANNDGYDLNGYFLSNKVCDSGSREPLYFQLDGLRSHLANENKLNNLSIKRMNNEGLIPSALLQLPKLPTGGNLQFLLETIFCMVR